MSHPITVAHFKDHFLPLSETFIYNLLQGLPEVNAIILNRFRQQNAGIFPVQTHISPGESLGSWAGWLERAALRTLGRSFYLESAIQKHRVDLIHAHFGQLGALIAPVARRRKIPLITSFYGIDISVFARDPAWAPRFARLWQTSRRVLALGPWMQQQLAQVGCPPPKIEILPLAVNVTQFDFRRRFYPQAEEPVRLLTIGRLIPKKGIDVLLQALAILRETRREPVHLTVGGDGPQRPALEQLTRQLDLADRVHFAGWLTAEQCTQQMANAHLFILASRRDPVTGETEGTPTVLLEAQACGLPVVATNHADIPFIVRHGESGLLADEGSPAALAAVLAEMLAHKQEWPAMGQAGRDYVSAVHDGRHVGVQLQNIYLKCLRET